MGLLRLPLSNDLGAGSNLAVHVQTGPNFLAPFVHDL